MRSARLRSLPYNSSFATARQKNKRARRGRAALASARGEQKKNIEGRGTRGIARRGSLVLSKQMAGASRERVEREPSDKVESRGRRAGASATLVDSCWDCAKKVSLRPEPRAHGSYATAAAEDAGIKIKNCFMEVL